MLSRTEITYTYDALGRLTEENSQNVTGDQPQLTYKIDYTYDLAGNRVVMTTTTSTGTVTVKYSYNNDYELLSETSSDGSVTTYTYDANGSELSMLVNGQAAEEFTYNLEGRLQTATVITTPASGQTQVTTTTYYYDNNGNKVRTDTTSSINGGPATATITDYVVDSQNPSGYAQVLEERNGTTHAVTMSYILGDDLLGQVGANLSSLRFFLSDGHGSTRLLTNIQGAITDRFAFTAFGVPVGFNPYTAATQFLFSGEQFDSFSGQYYMRARLYDPATGRFTQADKFVPVTGDALSLHRYVYAFNDPVNLTDPSGQNPNYFSGGAFFAVLGLVLNFAGLIPIPIVSNGLAIVGLLINLNTAYQDWVSVSNDTVYIANLKRDLPVVNPAAVPVVDKLQQLARDVLVADVGFIIGNIVGIGVGLIPIVGGVIGSLFGLVLAFWQLDVNSKFNATVALNLIEIMNFKVGFAHGASRGVRASRGMVNKVNSTLKDPQGLDTTKIALETFFGFNVGAWQTLKYASDVITGIDALFVTTNVAKSNAIATRIASNYSQTKKYLQDDFFKGAATGMIQVYRGSTVIATGPLLAGSASGASIVPNSGGLLSNGSPALAAILLEAISIWQSVLGRPLPLIPTVVVANLPPLVLGETYVGNWSKSGQPTDATILLSSDAGGAGWYDDAVTGSRDVFSQPLENNAYAAGPGSAASGHFDLLTTLLHEIGHVEGFLPSNPLFEQYVQTANGSQSFVGPGIDASLVNASQELNPTSYPGDLLSATLAPGVRELPSALDVRLINVISGIAAPASTASAAPVSVPPASTPVPVTTVVDHAVATLVAAPSEGKTAKKRARSTKGPAKHKLPVKQTAHKVTIKIPHQATAHDQKGAKRVIVKSNGNALTKKTHKAPDGSVAVNLSRRGAIVKRKPISREINSKPGE